MKLSFTDKAYLIFLIVILAIYAVYVYLNNRRDNELNQALIAKLEAESQIAQQTISAMEKLAEQADKKPEPEPQPGLFYWWWQKTRAK